MLALLYKLIIGDFRRKPIIPPCQHQWELVERGEVLGRDQWGTMSELPIKINKICCCTKCGEWRSFTV